MQVNKSNITFLCFFLVVSQKSSIFAVGFM